MIMALTPIKRLVRHKFPPTTVHLQYEIYLLFCMTLLTVSGMQGLYQESFGLPGDFIFLSLVVLWLSKHLVLRWLCIWDPSTRGRSPSISGYLTLFLTSHITGGQAFDRPTPQAVAKLTGAPYGENAYFSSFLPNSLAYLFQIPLLWVWFPLVRMWQGSSKKYARRRWWRNDPLSSTGGIGSVNSGGGSVAASYSNSRRSSAASSRQQQQQQDLNNMSRMHRTVNIVLGSANSLWTSYGPTLQFILPVALTSFYISKLFKIMYAKVEHPLSPISMSSPRANSARLEEESINPYGNYRKLEKPSWTDVFIVITALSILTSLTLYHRIVTPIPDQVAGGNVGKDLRKEARSGSSSNTYSKSSKGSHRLSHGKDHTEGVPWTERSKSIVAENRFRLTLDVALARILDYLFCCAVLPRTTYICRATGHCSPGAPVWELSKVMFPAGISDPLRGDGTSFTSNSMPPDHTYSLIFTFVGVAGVSTLLLLAQALLLNKSCLAMMGHHVGEWKYIGPANKSSTATASSVSVPWDSRRKFKKGDLIVYPPSGSRRQQSIYRATTNTPEGPPADDHMRMAHDWLELELGHSSTSPFLQVAGEIQLGYLFLNVIMVLFFFSWKSPAAPGAFTALVANWLAAHALLTVGTTNYSQLNRLNAEICGSP